MRFWKAFPSGIWLGVVPNVNRQLRDARARWCELLEEYQQYKTRFANELEWQDYFQVFEQGLDEAVRASGSYPRSWLNALGSIFVLVLDPKHSGRGAHVAHIFTMSFSTQIESDGMKLM